MSFVITKPFVARSLERLRGQPTHVMFAGYLHLQQRSGELGKASDLRPDFRRYFDRFFRVENHPIGTPYIKPFSHQKPSSKNLWLNENVAGSYAPSSIRTGQPFSKVVDISKVNGYSLRENHARLAFVNLLEEKPIPVVYLAAFLYRDYGLRFKANIHELVDTFKYEFGYANSTEDHPNNAFNLLYSMEGFDEWREDCFEVLSEDNDVVTPGDMLERRISLLRTGEPVRQLTANDLLAQETSKDRDDPPLQELRVRHLLSFDEETVFEFGRLNILVGPNGAGKSNLIDCLRIFRYVPIDIQQVFSSGGFEAWIYNGLDKQSGSGYVQLTAVIPGLPSALCHQLRLGPASRSRAQLEEVVRDRDETVESTPYFVGSYRSQPMLSTPGSGKRRREKELSGSDYNPFQSILSQIRDVGQYPEITRLASLYSDIRIYSEWSFGRNSNLRGAASAGRSDTRLSEDMHDLPVALNALEQTPAHEQILRLLPELKETYRDYVTRILFGRVGLELAETPFKVPVPADRLSDGTLRFLALAAILLQPNPPSVICIEEPELGMHPDMIRMVANMMAEAATRTQLIVSTHSEHLLTALQDDFDALFAFNAGATGSIIRKFSREDHKEWRKEHTLGELWTSGELGGNRW